MSIVTRFAPSPTGFLHLGHAHAALFARASARRAGGRFHLRLEDIDPTRCRPDYAAAIEEDLRWLGIDWDGPVLVQSNHLAEYDRVLASLSDRALLYPCFCTRADVAREIARSAAAPHGPDGGPVYPGTCRRLSPAARDRLLTSRAPHALRLDMEAALAWIGSALTVLEADEGRAGCHPERFGDVILARRDAPASYHLCVTHDDAVQGVTLVTRANDLRPATDIHRVLQALMGWPEPAYAHHPLLTDANGRRLAKRDGAETLRSLREAGRTPAETRALAGFPDDA